jgi:GGDEF domain-containing protein
MEEEGSMEAVSTAEAGDSSRQVHKAMKREAMNTINRHLQKLSMCARFGMVPFAILAICVTNGAYPGLAQQSAPATFRSAAEACQSLVQAVKRSDQESITKILGGEAELVTSQDDMKDKADRELFVQKYQEMHRLGHDPDGSVTLYNRRRELALSGSSDRKEWPLALRCGDRFEGDHVPANRRE